VLTQPPTQPIVIGHRGASGARPEHTLEAYLLAIQEGADYIEPDLVSTSDGHLVARHENEISTTTDVASHPQFANRFATKVIDGISISGWFTEDFTLAELKTLRAKERLPQLRGTSYDGKFQIPTLQEVIDLVASINFSRQADVRLKPVGIYPETKHPTYFDGIGLSMEERLVAILHANSYSGRNARVFIQSFEVSNLRDLATMTEVPLVQLLHAGGQPYDFTVSGDPRTYADLATPAGLAFISGYARGIGANKNLIIPRGSSNQLLAPTTLIHDAHRAGLIVHAWTFRGENTFLPIDFWRGTDPNRIGDMRSEAIRFLELGVDGFFTDHPSIGAAAVAAFQRW
jgi:glycerophosphoryl diester phosphodiesterase